MALLDEQRTFRDLLARAIRAEKGWKVVAEAGGACHAVVVCRETQPHLALVDLRLPHINEVELATCLRRHLPGLRIIALTDLTDSFAIRRVVEAGLQGYVDKNQPWSVLREAICQVAAGGTFYTEVYHQRVREMKEAPFSFPKVLSPRERQVLALVAEGHTSRAVAQRLGLGTRTVESHRRNIMKKMGLRNAADLIRFALNEGFRFETCTALRDRRRSQMCAKCVGG